ncbi:NADAR family protein [Chitinophaga nivalis]|uniref:NADAR family protein n=1 Tax=Chitinophaga nivalis TaxID=2991709 RepID=A0ABT3IM54_9BACT|nr:NADAR family protein [Chitinophaga nivalis]MCW3465500.1 NADAR family protein [Chitinophaga nivalis]MCW3484809.1 NADAR family protein [Chitinophaga nivalis]
MHSNKSIYSNSWLIEKFQAKEKIKYLFFWGHQLSPDGTVTKSCFSQWMHAPTVVDGIRYPTAEHWMMAGKARLFKDPETEQQILTAPSPAAAKKLGRQVKNFDPVIWDAHKFEIVVAGNIHKFSQHPAFKTFLLDTGDRVLVEASPMDRIWGIGMAASNEQVENPLKWRGENLLGYALMIVRDQLK